MEEKQEIEQKEQILQIQQKVEIVSQPSTMTVE